MSPVYPQHCAEFSHLLVNNFSFFMVTPGLFMAQSPMCHHFSWSNPQIESNLEAKMGNFQRDTIPLVFPSPIWIQTGIQTGLGFPMGLGGFPGIPCVSCYHAEYPHGPMVCCSPHRLAAQHSTSSPWKQMRSLGS